MSGSLPDIQHRPRDEPGRRGALSSRARAVAIVILLAACRDSATLRSDSGAVATPRATSARDTTTRPAAAGNAGAAASPPAAASPSAANAANACPAEGDWRECSVVKRLTDAGFVLQRKGASPAGVFPIPGTAYTLGAAEVHLYIFGSAAEREHAVAAIDTVTVARRGAPPPWPAPPILITSNNLAAVLVSDNGRLIERVQNAITAGLPIAVR